MLYPAVFAVLAALCAGDSRTVNFHNFEETVSINCASKTIPADNDTYVHYWLIPDYKVVSGYTMMLTNETYNTSATWIESDGWQLNIGWIRHTESGKYSCVWQEGGQERTDEIELKFIPPPQWEIYKDNVTVGLIVTAAFIGIIILIFIVYYFRWQDPDSRETRFNSNGINQTPDAAYENPAYRGAEPVVQVVGSRSSGGITESKM